MEAQSDNIDNAISVKDQDFDKVRIEMGSIEQAVIFLVKDLKQYTIISQGIIKIHSSMQAFENVELEAAKKNGEKGQTVM